MKRFFIILGVLSSLILCSCEPNNVRREVNPFFAGQSGANFSLNLNLISNQNLNTRLGPGLLFVAKSRALGSIAGVYIFTINDIDYFVYDLAEPNHRIGECSIFLNPESNRPEFNQNGLLEYTCGEERTLYDRFGQRADGNEGFPLRRYSAERTGDILRITF